MPKSFNILSHLTALRAFEVAARHESFQLAAQELNVTSGAVSRAIRQLETATGSRLFERLHRSVRLTEKGLELAQSVSPAFDQLRRAERSFFDIADDGDLVIAAPATFHLRWLVPRQGNLQKAIGDQNIYTTIWDKPPEPNMGSIAIFVSIGQPYPVDGCEVIELMPERFALVLSPASIAEGEEVSDCIARLPRLVPNTRPNIWSDWINEGGANTPHKGMRYFERLFLALQAAEAGVGTTIAPVEIVKDSLDSGALIMPFGSIRRKGTYHLVVPSRLMSTEHVKAAVRWFKKEARSAGSIS